MTCSKASQTHTAQKMKFYINDFISKCDQIRRILNKFLIENFFFAQCQVSLVSLLRIMFTYLCQFHYQKLMNH